MKKIKFMPFFLSLCIMMSVMLAPTAAAIDDPSVNSKAVVLIDIATGNKLYSSNEYELAYPASLTKIMTVLLAVEAIERGEVSGDDMVTASQNITFDLIDDGSTAGIVPGETMSFKDLLYCAMVSSANEACNIIAEHIAGSNSAFISLMNARAKELGCEGTQFANTHGLPNYNHYSSAQDFATIAMTALSYPMFMEIANTVTYTVPATNIYGERHLSNTNALINKDSLAYGSHYLYEGAAGIKTGHTNDAGYCLISTAKRNGMNLLCVVMGGLAVNRTEYMEFQNFSDSVKLYDWAFENYSYRDIVKITDLVEEVPVAMGKDSSTVTVHPQTPVSALLPNDDNLESFVQKITIYSDSEKEGLVAPIDAGEVLGEISIERDGITYGTSKLVASSSIDMSYSANIKGKIADTLKQPLVLGIVVVLILLIAGYIYLVIRYRVSRKRYVREMAYRKRQQEIIDQERQAYNQDPRIMRPNPQNAPQQGAYVGAQAPVQQATVQQTAAPQQAEPQPIAHDGGAVVTAESDEIKAPQNQGSEPNLEQTKKKRDYFEEFFGKK